MAGATSKSDGIRKRKQKRSKVSSGTTKPVNSVDKDRENKANEGTTKTSSLPIQSPSLWDRIADLKPFIGITLLVVLPHMFYTCYLYVCLQRPEWLAWTVSSLAACGLDRLGLPVSNPILRPAIRTADARQVLVVATMSSGTTQLAHELRSKLDLEIGHENSETLWSFVRDGTVSWFHGIRFLPRPGIDDPGASVEIDIPVPPKENHASQTDETGKPPSNKTVTLEGKMLFQYLVNLICRDLRPNMGFHPFMFRDNGKCSLRQSWGECWKDECTNLLEQEWGCGLRPKSPSDSCITPYRKILHLVRNPLKTVESLVTKFCIGGVDGDLQDPFVDFANALFPAYDFSALSCIEAAGYYVYEYNMAIIDATQKNYVDASFRIEDATPCMVAKMAGFFWEEDDEVAAAEEKQQSPEGGYQKQIRDHVLNRCSTSDSEDTSSSANRPMVSTKNKYNRGLLSLDWDDLLGGRHGSQKKEGDRDLQKRLKKMAAEFGYQ